MSGSSYHLKLNAFYINFLVILKISVALYGIQPADLVAAVIMRIAVIVIIFVFLLKRLGEKRVSYYLVPAILVWFLFYYSGIHATMTGVVMAMLIPMEARYNKAKFHRRNHILWEQLLESESVETNEPFPNGPQRHYLRHLYGLTKKTIPPSYRLEHKLNPIVNYAIMPIFALANAGVEIADVSLLNVFRAVDPALGSVGLGVFLGLLLGKPVGITLASWLAIRFKVGAMPSKAGWPMIFAVACLGGIGFTMSIFVDTLSFSGADPAVTQQLRDAGKIAVLLGSVASGLLGSLLITIVSKLKKPTI